MDLSPSGAAFVRVEEGFVGRFYSDATGTGTIGIGFTWASAAFREWWDEHRPGIKFGPGSTMTRDEADQALVYCFANEYGKSVNEFLGHDVPQNVFDGMASPVYNLGAGSLAWKWAAFAKAGDYPGCANALRTTGTTSKGKTLAGLVRRRKEEANLIENGVYAGVATTPAAVHDPVDTAMLDSVLTRGERGPAVAKLISGLSTLGYYTGKLDDMFGYGTEAAVLAFQRGHGLTADGDAGPDTLAAIASEMAKAAMHPAAAPPAPDPASPAPQTPAPAPAAPVVPVAVPSEAGIPIAPANAGKSRIPAAAGFLVLIAAALAHWWSEFSAWVHSLF